MKAVVWHGPGQISLDTVPDPTVRDEFDAVVGITTSALCGTDLHFVWGTMSGMSKGPRLRPRVRRRRRRGGAGGQEPETRHARRRGLDRGLRRILLLPGRLLLQCDSANPNDTTAGTTFFGGPDAAGGLDGMQAEYVRVPFAHVGAVPLPDGIDGDQAIMLSDIYPTAWFGARLAQVSPGDTVAVFGAGPVGQFAVLSAFQQGCRTGAGRRRDRVPAGGRPSARRRGDRHGLRGRRRGAA